MRDDLIELDEDPLEFVGAYSSERNPQRVAAAMEDILGIHNGWAGVETDWTGALYTLRDLIESAGVLAVFNGVVGNNTYRKLDPGEFHGFALVDEYAPLVFVNNAGYRAGQIFTLVHELAHILVGETGLSSLRNMEPTGHYTEVRCSQIAAEFLVPERQILDMWESVRQECDPFRKLARHFNVSTVVVARRALDTDLVTQDSFLEYYGKNRARKWTGGRRNGTGGGGFWNSQRWRLGIRFAAAARCAVLEGRLTYTEAYRLTDLEGEAFDKMPEKMGFIQ